MRRPALITALCLLTVCMALSQNKTPSSPRGDDDTAPIRLYPHPATSFLALRLQQPEAEHIETEVRSLIGNKIAVERETVNPYEVRIQVKHLPSGYYFISIRNKMTGARFAYRFLKR